MLDVEDFVTEKKNSLLKSLEFVLKTTFTACHLYHQQVIVSQQFNKNNLSVA